MFKSRSKHPLIAWILYDFANSPYTTLVITFVYATYFVKSVAADEITGTTLWANAITITGILVAILAPILGKIADNNWKTRKLLLTITTILTAATTALLFFVPPGAVLTALFFVIISNIAFELSNVFYNAMLPALSPKEKLGFYSGLGWGAGYIGGLFALGIALIGFVATDTPWFGMSTELGLNIRATNLLVAAWFIIFAIPLLRIKQTETKKEKSKSLTFRATLNEMKQYPEVVRLLFARLLYNDGLVTIFAFGGIYAAGTFNFSFKDILLFGIVLNIAAGIGSLVMGIADDTFGGKRIISISIVFLSIATLVAATAPDRMTLWGAGVVIGLFAGPCQAGSRSLLARMTPHDKENQFFGFFAFSGKLTTFAGPFVLGLVTHYTGSQRWGVASILLFLFSGMFLLLTVNEKKGIKEGEKRTLLTRTN